MKLILRMQSRGPLFFLCLLFAVILLLPAAGKVMAWSVQPTQNTAICTALGNQEFIDLISDGSGGAIITWMDWRSGNIDIYAQRVNSSGAVQWTANGVPICTALNDQWYPQLISDGSGGAIITWMDPRSGNIDIYVQRVNSNGAVQWTADGVPICTAPGEQKGQQLTSDGSGGAIIIWWDQRSGMWDIYAQRVNSSGAVQWAANGVPICTALGDQTQPQLTSDGSGGAIITWEDLRSSNWDIYAQRVDSSGSLLNILTVSGITASNKTYDGGVAATLDTGSASLVGVLSGDSVSLGGTASGAFADKNVGPGKTVTISGLTLSGADAYKYALTQPTTTADITAKNLTVSGITASNKTYDGTTSATLNTASASLVWVVSGDSVSLGGTATGAFADKNVDTGKTVTVSGLSLAGADAANYSLTQATTTADITVVASHTGLYALIIGLVAAGVVVLLVLVMVLRRRISGNAS
ncbi:MAG: YDG domain-containing protein [Chloroflexi bacterium]|nr:YDG domain-containing protein [Chloroflexota bacterium]